MKLISMLGLLSVCVAVTASSVCAQEAASAAAPAAVDSAALNVVKEFSVRSGKIALASAANPGPAYLPDGTYTNEDNTVLVILDGKISRLQKSSGELVEIASVHANRFRGITLTPSTNALMTVSDITLPSGTFRSTDGASSMRVLQGRPTLFTIPAPAASH